MPKRPSAVTRFVAEHPALSLVFVLLVALSARVILARQIVVPWIMPDEITYSGLANSFLDTGRLLLRGQPTPAYSILYPILIAPAWLFDPMGRTYVIAKEINAVLVTLAAVPLYLWARRLVGAAEALVGVVLYQLLPSLLYSGMLMSESAFLPAFIVATYAGALVLERPTLARQAFVFVTIAVATAVRIQAVILVPILVTAVLVFAVLEARSAGPGTARRSIWRLWPSAAGVALLVVGYVALTLAQGVSPSWVLGAYRIVTEVDYSVQNAARWVVYHYAELALSVGMLPVAALILLVAQRRLWRGDTTTAERAFLAIAVATVAWLPLQAGVFASRFSDRVEERNMFYAVPLLLLALVVWLARPEPKARRAMAAALIVPVALVAVLPLDELLNNRILSDTFALVPLFALRGAVGLETVTVILWMGIAALAYAFLWTRDRMIPRAVPAALAAVFVVTTLSVSSQLSAYARSVLYDSEVASQVSWIDDLVGPRAAVGILHTVYVKPNALWQTEFWNRSVGPVLAVGEGEPGGLPHVSVTLDALTGHTTVNGDTPPYLVASPSDVPVGERIGARGPWTLWRIDPPLRFQNTYEGVYPDGWMGADAVYRSFYAPGGPSLIEVTLSRKPWGGTDRPGRVRIELRSADSNTSLAVEEGVIHSLDVIRFVLVAQSSPFQIRFHIEPTFAPAEFGEVDERQLGAVVSVRLLPRD